MHTKSKPTLEILNSTLFTKGVVVDKSRLTLGVIGTKGYLITHIPNRIPSAAVIEDKTMVYRQDFTSVLLDNEDFKVMINIMDLWKKCEYKKFCTPYGFLCGAAQGQGMELHDLVEMMC